MCRFIETIRVDCGEVRNTAYHERRMNDTRTHFWPESPALQLAGYLPAIPGSGVFVDNLFACPSPNYTPDGKTVLATIKEDDIEKLFSK